MIDTTPFELCNNDDIGRSKKGPTHVGQSRHATVAINSKEKNQILLKHRFVSAFDLGCFSQNA